MSVEVLSSSEFREPSGCHHCGAPIDPHSPTIQISGQQVRVCSDPCRTAVETIGNAKLDAWYDLRTHTKAQGAATADPRHRAELDAWCVPEVEASLLRRGGQSGDNEDYRTSTGHSNYDGTAPAPTAVTLTVEGMRCAGCAWLVERLLASIPGVTTATVDFPLRRAEVLFDTHATRLHTLLETLAKAGYRATPYTVHAEEAAIESERRARIRGLGISALFGMQVMLLSIALYASDWYGGMEAGFEQLFRWLAMMLTVPVLVWPGRTFFTGAAAALRGGRLTIDVPVALGLSIAFVGSAFATVSGEGDVWFDSVVMFVTLLSGARYLELLARRRATAAIRALARSAPPARPGCVRTEPTTEPGYSLLAIRLATATIAATATTRRPNGYRPPRFAQATAYGCAPARWFPPTAPSAPDTRRSMNRCSPESRIQSHVRPAAGSSPAASTAPAWSRSK